MLPQNESSRHRILIRDDCFFPFKLMLGSN